MNRRAVIPQSSAAWLPARVGCVSASRVAAIFDGAQARKTLMHQLVAERLTGYATETYVTQAMQWGIDNEPSAAGEYEYGTGILLSSAGLVMHRSIEFFCATPDRFCGATGALEIKCPTTKTFAEWFVSGGVPDKHLPQLLAQLACCEWLEWVDFMAYDPRIVGGRKNNMIVRVERTDYSERIGEMEDGVAKFLQETELMFEEFTYT